MAKIKEREESGRIEIDESLEDWRELEGPREYLDVSNVRGLESSEIDHIQEAVRLRLGEALMPALLMDDGRLIRIFPYETLSTEHRSRGFPSFSPTGVEKDHPSIYVNPDSMIKSIRWKAEQQQRKDLGSGLRSPED